METSDVKRKTLKMKHTAVRHEFIQNIKKLRMFKYNIYKMNLQGKSLCSVVDNISLISYSLIKQLSTKNYFFFLLWMINCS